ncbi:MAG: FAD-binding oxidoreductase [Chitinophagales bacterium]|nr:FAD-binding oxidoreductase [Chitinophagales bacterium]
MLRQVDYIIVGQGIAGSMIAHFLLKRGKKILVVDEYNPNASSNIAAGVVNPVTGRKMVKTWLIDEILPFAKEAYKALEKDLNISFFFERDIYKIFSSQEDAEIWKVKKSDSEYEQYMGDIVFLDETEVKTPYGAGIIKQCCWMDVPGFTKAYRAFLSQNGILLAEEFNFEQLELTEVVRYKDTIAEKIIFCEGFKAYKNPFFKKIPFAFAKGEQLIIRAEKLKTDKIISRNIFIIPKGNDLYTVGSTFIWDDLEETVTELGRKEIQSKLNKIIAVDYTIVQENAGIRPAMPDRRPVMGSHPDYPQIYIFNGMGTKGVSLSPYFASYFLDSIDNGTEVFREISVNRFVI